MARLTGNGILFDLLNPDDKIESFYWMYPAGTRKVFWQATAPTGWTQDTSMGGDKGLRVVNGTGGGTGGTTNFSTVLSGTNSLSVPINETYTISGTVGNHTLSVSQLPDHTHTSNIGPAGGANATPFSNTGALQWMVMSIQEEWFLLVVVDLMITHLVVVLQSIRLLY